MAAQDEAGSEAILGWQAEDRQAEDRDPARVASGRDEDASWFMPPWETMRRCRGVCNSSSTSATRLFLPE
jgi:hypothetical protein